MPQLLQEWDGFAATCVPAANKMDMTALRNHAEDLLMWVVDDMESGQTSAEQRTKSLGLKVPVSLVDSAAEGHAAIRVAGHFTIEQIVAEFRALRASVLRLRAESLPSITAADVEEMTRFNESIDQMLSESVARYASLVEDTLRQESASKDRFIAILSHELRNPLNALVAASTLLDNGGDKDQVRHVLRRQTGHLKRLLDDLLDLSRIVLNLVSLHVECVKLQSCIDDALIAVREIIERKNQTLSVQMPDQPIVIEADCTRVTQIVTNLVNNAAKHSPAGSHIDVAVRHDGHKVEISVRDDGPGINADQLPHLFARFHEGTKREARNLSGLGIGLWLSRTLAELHGGQIIVKSDGPGHGSEFVVTLPRVSAAQA